MQELFDRYIKDNILHRTIINTTEPEIGRIVSEQLEAIRKINSVENKKALLQELTTNLKNAVEGCENLGEVISNLITYQDHLKEIKSIIKKVEPKAEYLELVGFIYTLTKNYNNIYQISARNKIIANRLLLLNKQDENINYLKVIKDYERANNKNSYTIKMKYSNATPYSYLELKEIENKTEIPISNSNMLMDEGFILNDLSNLIKKLTEDINEFKRTYQEAIILSTDMNCDLDASYTELLDIDAVLGSTVGLVGVLNQVVNIDNTNLELFLQLNTLEKISNDIKFIKESYTLVNENNKINEGLVSVNNQYNSALAVINEFIKQKSELKKANENNQTSYIVEAGSNTKEVRTESLSYNQNEVINRERLKKENIAIDASIAQWLEGNPFDYNTKQNSKITEKSLTNLAGSYSYITDLYKNTTTDFDELFREKIINKIEVLSKIFHNNLEIVAGTIGILTGAIQGLLTIEVNLVQGALDIVITSLNALKCVIKAIICAIASIINTIVDVLDFINPFARSLDNLKNLTTSLTNLPGYLIENISALAKETASKLFGNIKENIDTLYNDVKNQLGIDKADQMLAALNGALSICEGKATNNLTQGLISLAKEGYGKLFEDINLNKSSRTCPSLFANLDIPELNTDLEVDFKGIHIPKLQNRIGNC